MRRLLGAILALSLMSGAAAVAGPYGHGGSGYGVTTGYSHGDRGWYGHRDHGNNDGAAIATGVGILALIAILAAQNQHEDQQGVYDRNGDQQYVPYDRGDDGYRGEPDGRYAPGQMHQ